MQMKCERDTTHKSLVDGAHLLRKTWTWNYFPWLHTCWDDGRGTNGEESREFTGRDLLCVSVLGFVLSANQRKSAAKI